MTNYNLTLTLNKGCPILLLEGYCQLVMVVRIPKNFQASVWEPNSAGHWPSRTGHPCLKTHILISWWICCSSAKKGIRWGLAATFHHLICWWKRTNANHSFFPLFHKSLWSLSLIALMSMLGCDWNWIEASKLCLEEISALALKSCLRPSAGKWTILSSRFSQIPGSIQHFL